MVDTSRIFPIKAFAPSQEQNLPLGQATALLYGQPDNVPIPALNYL